MSLPDYPGLDAPHSEYRAWVDAMCAHVRAMAERAAVRYHQEQLAHHAHRLGELSDRTRKVRRSHYENAPAALERPGAGQREHSPMTRTSLSQPANGAGGGMR